MFIRFATAEDLPALVEIYNASIPGRLATADTQPVSVESRRAWLAQHHARRPIWVACEGQQVVGYVSLRDFYGRPAYHITAEIAVYVHPQFQRRGIARMLLSHAIDAAPTLGLENILAFIFSHNAPSLRLFQSLGFEPRGQFPRIADLDGGRVGLTILAKTIRRSTDNL